MKKYIQTRLFLFFAFWLMAGLSACVSIKGSSSVNTPTSYLIESPTMTITPQILASRSPTASPASSSTPTPIPLPTLSQKDSNQKINNLMKTNGGCLLPCLWGITPGKSLLSETQYQFNQFMQLKSAQLDGVEGGAEFTFPEEGPFKGSFGSLYLRSKNDYVMAIRLEGYYNVAQNYAIQDVLQKNGIPDNIWIYTLRDSYGEGVLPFIITLDYSSRGFIVYYNGNGQARYDVGLIELCYSQGSIPTKLLAWNIDNGNPFAEHKSDYIYTIWAEMKSIEDAMNMNKDEFYRLFVSSKEIKSVCVNTPALLWEY